VFIISFNHDDLRAITSFK